MNDHIVFDRVSVTYAGTPAPALRDVCLRLPAGELVLVVGDTGGGKSTLLGCINGLVPHFTGGTLAGRVTVAGRDTATHPPRQLADVVGTVGQDPLAGFVTETVEDELAYVMECLGVPAPVMRRRVEETLDLLRIADLRDRPLRTLSGGQQQRVAIGAALTAHPEVLVLDEPTSALDPGAAEDVLAALQRLVHDLGMTVVLAEHRLERVLQYADTVVVVEDRRVRADSPARAMLSSPIVPPVVELGRLAGWSPLPLSVRDARRVVGPLREALHTCTRPAEQPAAANGIDESAGGDAFKPSPSPSTSPLGPAVPTAAPVAGRRPRRLAWPRRAPREEVPPSTTEDDIAAGIQVSGVTAGYDAVSVLRGVDLTVTPGEVCALMGRNGSGKSTLLRLVAGLHRTDAGSVRVCGQPPAYLSGPARLSRLGFVPQDPTDLLFARTVAAELDDADRLAQLAPGTAAASLADLAPDIPPLAHPRDLSEGQRMALALAVVLAAGPRVLVLDEPTRGLDYRAKRRLVETLARLRRSGRALLLATHDVELAAAVATRVAVVAGGRIIADGPTDELVLGSPVFAPQVAKILAPEPWLTVDAVAHALSARSQGGQS